jgi:hypothetical protein
MDHTTHLCSLTCSYTLANKKTQGDDENCSATGVQRNVGDLQVGARIILKLVSNIVEFLLDSCE